MLCDFYIGGPLSFFTVNVILFIKYLKSKTNSSFQLFLEDYARHFGEFSFSENFQCYICVKRVKLYKFCLLFARTWAVSLALDTHRYIHTHR